LAVSFCLGEIGEARQGEIVLRLITFFEAGKVNYAQPIQHNKQWLGAGPVSSCF